MQRRRLVRYFLGICLLAAATFAAWTWLRPYEWKPDPAARCTVVETLVTRDHSFFWVDVHLKMRDGFHHDLQKPVRLLVGGKTAHEPADTTLAGAAEDPDELWYKFWLNPKEIHDTLDLQINNGVLHVKANHGIPDIEPQAFRNHRSNRW